MLKLCVCVATKDRLKLLQKSLGALISQNFDSAEYEIIVIDDGSKEDIFGFVDKLKANFKNLRCLRQESLGLASARNLAVKNTTANIVAFTDNDVIADKNWLKEIYSAFEDGENDVVGVEGKIITDSPRMLFTNAPENLRGGKFIGANSAYLKKIIVKAGYFDEKMNFWREDSDFAFRAMEFGNIAFAEKAIIYHPLRKTQPSSVFHYLGLLRNDWVCFFKHPRKYLEFIGFGFLKDFLKSILAYFSLFAILFLIFSNAETTTVILAVFFFIALFVFFPLLKFKVGFKIKELSEILIFVIFNYVKDLAYPIYFSISFFNALKFMVVK